MNSREKRAGPPPRRRWGQNFLADTGLAESLVRRFEPGSGDRVVEIGPGRGALTRHLAPQVGRLVALEIDPLLIAGLESLLEPWPHAQVWHLDAMEADWEELAEACGGRFRVIANLPYNVGTPIVRRLLASPWVLDLQVVLQLEVVERFLAEAGHKTYGPLAVITALRARRRRVAVIAPGAFHPRPKVRSAAMRLELLEEPPLPAEEIPVFETWLFAGFRHRRKTLAGNLSENRDTVRDFLEDRGLPRDARAEVVPPQDWLDLARLLQRAAAK